MKIKSVAVPLVVLSAILPLVVRADEAIEKATRNARTRFGGNEAYVYMKGNTVSVGNDDLDEMRRLLQKKRPSCKGGNWKQRRLGSQSRCAGLRLHAVTK